ncbi:MAG TPA: VWA domain-containing protein [Terracidiphilus sp.]|jgi:VWFA-related protein|nr:VWA domain-containing protein [Terracidiphilus sp.]
MRRLVILVLPAFLALFSLPALAAHRIPVAQLEQNLSAAIAEHHSDADIAKMVANVELSERLTPITLGRLAAKLPIQPRTALALKMLADQSAFLDPPPSEIPATEPPDAAAQQHILELARGYVVETMPRLPNLFATRAVTQFDDAAQVPHPGDWPVRVGLHLDGSTSRSVTFRDGKEVADAPAGDAAAKADLGLYSFGEFGPVLARTFTDLVNGKVQFSHWEQTPLGIAAVYQFEVPKADSHYQVHFCCLVSQSYAGRRTIGDRNVGRRAAETSNPAHTQELQPFDATPAYHGSLSIDPGTGAIVRIAIEAELSTDDPIQRAATVVEYGRVSIGGQDFICPVRSLAISLQQAPYTPNGQPQQPPILRINENAFADYHRLGSTVRVIADGAQPAGSGNPAADIPALTATPAAAAPSAPSAAAGPSTQAPSGQQVAAAAPPATAPAAAPPPAPAPPLQPVIPEISMAAATGVPDVSTNPNSGYSLKITSHLVDVGAIVFDKHGHPVTDLKPEDFELYDDGQKRDIRFFTAAQPEAPAAAPATTFTNRAPDTVVAAPASASAGTVLLIDESHIAWTDLNYARGQMLKFLSRIAPDAPVGLYSMNGLGFHVLLELTTDHAAVAARLKAFLPSAQSINQAQEEERRNRQSFDYVHNAADLNSVNGNHGDVVDADQPVDPELLSMGDNPARASFIILAQVARHLAAISGHKSLVWVSSDNVLADWEDQGVAVDKGPKMVESYARRAEEAMNEAHAAVYPFDVSQLEAGTIGADLQNSNVQLTAAAEDNAATAAGAAGPKSAPAPSARETGTGRINAAMSQDLHPIQGPVRDVATGTGGRTIRRSGDLAAELAGIVEDGRAAYQLSFYPQGAPDDKYHALTVKLNGRHGLTVRYRTGYLFGKEPVSMKDRFRNAVWQPTDSSEIGVTASVEPSGAGSSIKLNIAAADLAMEQQGGRWMDRLDIFFIQRDDAGIHARVEGQTLGLRLRPATYQNLLPVGVPFEHAVEMQPGMGSLRVLVVDENSGRMGSVTIPFRALHVAN